MTYEITPFVKWVGGKRQLIDKIKIRMPKNYNNYFEPFVGGGALFMELQPINCYINDANSELISAYRMIKSKPDQLMKLLDEHEAKHSQNSESYYYKVRELDRDENWSNVSELEKAARFIYLNKACFNGMYRVNAKGYFNVPFNQKDTVKLYQKENIKNINLYLNEANVVINNGDFEEILKHAKSGDFIFFDPPYDLLNKDSFVSYTKDGFGEEGQKRLADVAHQLSDKGCYVMITNHNTPLINNLYKDFHIDVVEAKRMINSDATKRNGVETIIYNYDIEDLNI